MPKIQDLPEEDRPRERLLRLGAASLTDAELLAIFINTGVKGENAVQVAQRLLATHTSLRQLSRLEANQLAQERALGPAKAAHLAAAFELGRRAEQEKLREQPLNDPELIFRYFMHEMQALPYEIVRIAYVNQRMNLVHHEELFRGTINETTAHHRDIISKVLIRRVPSFILVHNHPSGNPSPSDADVRLTRRVREAANLLGLNFLDHVIIGQPSEDRAKAYFSFRESGLL